MVDQLVAQLQGLHFHGIQAQRVAWQPAVNVYAHADRLEICVDLAGVRKEDIQVHVEPRRVVVRGFRKSPDHGRAQPFCNRVLAMEIPDGSFERIVEFPLLVASDRALARQDNGWLWITLPMLAREGIP